MASSSTPKQVDIIKKKICKIFKENGLSITVAANKKVVQYLDVEFDLNDGSYKPFTKPNDIPIYVHIKSNHPRTITKNIPAAVNRRLSALSSSEAMFETSTQIYQDALNKAGYKYKLKYDPTVKTNQTKTRSRK